MHPGVRFEIPDKQIDSCANFLDNFVDIFTLNYDLQLYWVILQRLQKRHTDGFGLGNEANGFRTFGEGAYCSTYYLHGALHLFEDEKGGTRKRVLTSSTIVDDIAATIRSSRQLPLFVAEGTTLQKLKKINSVPYLRYCYENLKTISGSIIIFGHSASENDIHIYNAIFSSPELKRVFFCVHSPEHDWSQLRERLARFSETKRRRNFLRKCRYSGRMVLTPPDMPALSGRCRRCSGLSSRDCRDCRWDRSRRGSPVRRD